MYSQSTQFHSFWIMAIGKVFPTIKLPELLRNTVLAIDWNFLMAFSWDLNTFYYTFNVDAEKTILLNKYLAHLGRSDFVKDKTLGCALIKPELKNEMVSISNW